MFCLPLEGKVPRNEADEVLENKKQKLNFIKSATPHHRLTAELPLKGKPYIVLADFKA